MPVERLIAPDAAGWPNAAELEHSVAAWEQQSGHALPSVYRTFILTYGGGFVYPNVYDSPIPQEVTGFPDTQVICDRLYDWDYAAALWRGDTYDSATPKGLFFLGSELGYVELLISLRPHDYGVIYAWPYTSTPWGEPQNDDSRLYRLAGSFKEFVMGLFDTPERIGYDAWFAPQNAKTARRLVID